MSINLQNLLISDQMSQLITKLNYNFEQIILAGGGPQGPAGLQGIRGPAGAPGSQGIQGITGDPGIRWFFGNGDPNTGTLIYPTTPLSYVEGDLWLDVNTTKIYGYTLVPSAQWVYTGASFNSSFFGIQSFLGGNDYYLNDRDGNLVIGYDDKTPLIGFNVNPNESKFRINSNTGNHIELSLSGDTTSAYILLEELSDGGSGVYKNMRLTSPSGMSFTASRNLDILVGDLSIRTSGNSSKRFLIDFPNINLTDGKIILIDGTLPSLSLTTNISSVTDVLLNRNTLNMFGTSPQILLGNVGIMNQNLIELKGSDPQILFDPTSTNIKMKLSSAGFFANNNIFFSKFDGSINTLENCIGLTDAATTLVNDGTYQISPTSRLQRFTKMTADGMMFHHVTGTKAVTYRLKTFLPIGLSLSGTDAGIIELRLPSVPATTFAGTDYTGTSTTITGAPYHLSVWSDTNVFDNNKDKAHYLMSPAGNAIFKYPRTVNGTDVERKVAYHDYVQNLIGFLNINNNNTGIISGPGTNTPTITIHNQVLHVTSRTTDPTTQYFQTNIPSNQFEIAVLPTVMGNTTNGADYFVCMVFDVDVISGFYRIKIRNQSSLVAVGFFAGVVLIRSKATNY